MKINNQQTPRVEGFRRPLAPWGFLCARGFIILETVGTDGLRGWRFDSVRARFDCTRGGIETQGSVLAPGSLAMNLADYAQFIGGLSVSTHSDEKYPQLTNPDHGQRVKRRARIESGRVQSPFYAQPDSERVLKSLSRSHNDRKSSDWGFLTHQPVSRCRLPRLSGRWGTRTVDYLNQGSQILRGSQPQMPVRHPVYRKTLETHNAVSGRACVTPRIQGLNSW